MDYLVLDRSTSPYDILHRNASSAGWLNYQDGEIYPLSTMLNSDGLAALAQQSTWAWYRSAQRDAFTRWRRASSDGFAFRCWMAGPKKLCSLSWDASPPSVFAFRISLPDSPANAAAVRPGETPTS